VKTSLGWVVSGPLKGTPCESACRSEHIVDQVTSSHLFSVNSEVRSEINLNLNRSWSLDSIGILLDDIVSQVKDTLLDFPGTLATSHCPPISI